ncbi:choice-of-anchor L domain-containing protein [Anabaena sphaerica FACHB-251]|uniref:Choice-of-anchor L domain-containing protein n=1 Tax=Anabaena sphaerica FACHB-251 TaxID=2692883 RepID=A0A926WJQ6_9NOST|nr:choice-of-anchor L domain-containing protein [Anabaena sphaerica]MBD2295367.1 choice-of-anchor L domain-containing protein [Anabaena sphaerica FACHB-251]
MKYVNFLKNLSIVAAAAVSTTVALGGQSAASAFTVTQNNNPNDLLNSLLGSNTSGLSGFTVTTTGNANAFGLFNNDPFGLGSGVVLSTGNVVDVIGPNDTSSKTTSYGTPGDTPGSFDLAQLDISFFADNTVSNVFFEYVFGSEEFLEYAGSQFNDSFELLLNGTNLALLANGNFVTINNLANSPSGPFNPAYINNTGNATQLDGYTTNLTFQGAVNKNAVNTLSIKIKDVGDSVLDSAVLLKGGSISVVPPKTTPEPASLIGILGLGAFGITSLRKRKQQAAVKA